METIRSDQIVKNFHNQKIKYKRKKSEFSGTIEATPQEIFPLLCPTREADWIPGWNVELVYTDSGYAEDKCIFRTSEFNISGEGIWTFTGYEKDKYIEFVKFQSDMMTHVKISLIQDSKNKTTIIWNTISTALTEKGNHMIESMSGHHSRPLINLLTEYLKEGRVN